MSYLTWSRKIVWPGSASSEEAEAAAVSVPNVAEIPLDNSPNQSFRTTIYVDGENRQFQFFFHYNEMASYWCMRITDPLTGTVLMDSVPLVTGDYPAANLLGQQVYLAIGSAWVIPEGNSELDFPDDESLGTLFRLLWGDTPDV